MMFTLERQSQILDILKEKKTASIAALSKQFFIGEATIRRDLQKLEKRNLIKRTYGGAVLLEGLTLEIPLSIREKEQSYAKDKIGRAAAELVSDGDTLILDSSSTTFNMIKYLHGKENLTFITNGIKTASAIGENLHARVYCTGGRLRENSLSLVGDQAKTFIKNYSMQKLFFSCRALSAEYGATDSSDEEAELRKDMIACVDKAIILCDSNKFDTKAFYKICDFEKISCIVTDKKPSKKYTELFASKNIELIY